MYRNTESYNFVLKVPLHGLEVFLNSVFTLMNTPLKSPTYTCISKHSKTLKVKYHLPSRGSVSYVVIDAINLKVDDEGE
ncbi:transposase [Candidatus Enterovibrio escicola]|nr:transposase [Candidatus Enterovibrio escacola]